MIRYYFFFVILLGCSHKVSSVKSENKIESLKALSTDCEMVKKEFTTQLDTIKGSYGEFGFCEIWYKYDKKRIYILSNTNCFTGLARNEIESILGRPSKSYGVNMTYYFISAKHDKFDFYDLFFSFKGNNESNSLLEIGLTTGIFGR